MRAFQRNLPSLCGFFVIIIVWNIALHPILQETLQSSSVFNTLTPHIHHSFLLVLGVTFVLLSHVHTYKDDYLSGRLTFITSNQVPVIDYCLKKFSSDWCGYVVPLSLLSWGFPIFSSHTLQIVFLMTILCMLTLALLFAHLISTLSLAQDTLPLFSFVLVWPFLIPPLLLCLTLLNNAPIFEHLDSTDGLILLGAILCISSSICLYFLVRNITHCSFC